jgi:hypothetical protein
MAILCDQFGVVGKNALHLLCNTLYLLTTDLSAA